MNTLFGISEVLMNSTLIEDWVIGNSNRLYVHSCSDISLQLRNLFTIFCTLCLRSMFPFLASLAAFSSNLLIPLLFFIK